MRKWQLAVVLLHHADGEWWLQVLEPEEAGPLAGSYKLEQHRFLFLSEVGDNLPELRDELSALNTVDERVLAPVCDVNGAAPGEEVVELAVVEYLDAVFEDDGAQSLPDQPGLPLHRPIHFVVYQQADILFLVVTADFDVPAAWLQIHQYLAQAVLVLEGQLQLLHPLLHLHDEQHALVEVRIDLEEVVEAVLTVDQQIQERPCEFDAEHDIGMQ